jgi:hypothetical protein
MNTQVVLYGSRPTPDAFLALTAMNNYGMVFFVDYSMCIGFLAVTHAMIIMFFIRSSGNQKDRLLLQP